MTEKPIKNFPVKWSDARRDAQPPPTILPGPLTHRRPPLGERSECATILVWHTLLAPHQRTKSSAKETPKVNHTSSPLCNSLTN